MSEKKRKQGALIVLTAVLGGALVIICSVSLGVRVAGHAAAPGVVTFDTARYLNARRASMAALIGKAQAGDTSVNPAAMIHKIDDMARPAIENLAAGRLVIVRQAMVLDKQAPDITDAVIEKLGLPKVTTTVPAPSIDDMASSYSTSNLYQAAIQLQQSRNEAAKEKAPQLKAEAVNERNQAILP